MKFCNELKQSYQGFIFTCHNQEPYVFFGAYQLYNKKRKNTSIMYYSKTILESATKTREKSTKMLAKVYFPDI